MLTVITSVVARITIRVMRWRGVAAIPTNASRTRGKASPIMGIPGRSKVLGMTGESESMSVSGVGSDAAVAVVGFGDSVGGLVGMMTPVNRRVGPTLTIGTGVGVGVGTNAPEPIVKR
jgi:hypothetical protein